MIILGLHRKHAYGIAPTWQVQCGDCEVLYVRTGWKKDVESTPRCKSCARKISVKASMVKRVRDARGCLR